MLFGEMIIALILHQYRPVCHLPVQQFARLKQKLKNLMKIIERAQQCVGLIHFCTFDLVF